jgi:phenylacetate-CoA ligase
MIWNEAKECMSRDQMHNLQSARLKSMVSRVYHNVPFYRTKMQQLGVEPGDIETIDDLVKLPFTSKQDLRDNYPFGLFATPKSEIVRVHASSGTTGKPTVVAYTRKDIEVFSEVVTRALVSAGATKDDIVQVAYGYGLFTGGLGLHYGAENLGLLLSLFRVVIRPNSFSYCRILEARYWLALHPMRPIWLSAWLKQA